MTGYKQPVEWKPKTRPYSYSKHTFFSCELKKGKCKVIRCLLQSTASFPELFSNIEILLHVSEVESYLGGYLWSGMCKICEVQKKWMKNHLENEKMYIAGEV